MTRIAIILGAIITAVVAVGAMLLVYDDLAAPPIIITDPVTDGMIVVQISGAVGTPGVYEVSADARVADVVAAAGGTAPDADLGAINLARRLRDEDQLVIPTRAPPTPVTPSTGREAGPAAVPQPLAPVNINTATLDQLDSLPGIGPAIGQRIIDYRAEHGPFRTVDELDNVNGISSTMVDELRPEITVGE